LHLQTPVGRPPTWWPEAGLPLLAPGRLQRRPGRSGNHAADGIAAIANSHVFVANAHYVFGDMRAWGWITEAARLGTVAAW
jgi:hypothetical protein